MPRQRGRIPGTNTAIILLCLAIIGLIVLVYPLLEKPLGLDLLGIITLLFIIILALLDHAGVRVSRAVNWVKGLMRGEGSYGKKQSEIGAITVLSALIGGLVTGVAIGVIIGALVGFIVENKSG